MLGGFASNLSVFLLNGFHRLGLDRGLDAKEKTTSALEEVDNCIEDAVPMRVSRAAYVIISLATSSTYASLVSKLQVSFWNFLLQAEN